MFVEGITEGQILNLDDSIKRLSSEMSTLQDRLEYLEQERLESVISHRQSPDRALHCGGGGPHPRAVHLAWRLAQVPRSLKPTQMPPSQSHT